MTHWNRLFNYQRDALVKLPVWTTEADRQRALAYADRDLATQAQEAIKAVQDGLPSPADLGLIVAVARYEDAGWMPDGCFDRWRRWVFPHGTEHLAVTDLVQWLGAVEDRLRTTSTADAAPACVDHWHCDPREASHACDRPDRAAPCPTCGALQPDLTMPDGLDAAGQRAHTIITAYLRSMAIKEKAP